MKKNLFFLSLMFLIVGCTNDSTPKQLSSVEKETENDAPYISPNMQELINKLDTANGALPVNKLIPGFENTLIKDLQVKQKTFSTRTTVESSGENISTDADTIIVYGYDSYYNLFMNKKITLSQNAYNALNMTLNIGNTDYVKDKTVVYLSAWAVVRNISFASKQTDLEEASIKGDHLGYDPDKFPTSIDTTSIINKGFKIEEEVPGIFYHFTTYVIGACITYNKSSFIRISPGILGDLLECMESLNWRIYHY